MIYIKVSKDDYEKIKILDEIKEENNHLILQTSGAQYIKFSYQPERSKREDQIEKDDFYGPIRRIQRPNLDAVL